MALKTVAVNDRGRRIGDSHPLAKLTDHEIDLIRTLHEEEGMSYKTLAEKFEISQWTVGRICRYERRAQIPAGFREVHMTQNDPVKINPMKKSTYTEKLSEEICNRIKEGEPLRQICRDKGMPSWRTVYNWMKDNPDFASRIAHARPIGYDAIAEDTLRIADTPLLGEEIEEADGKVKVRRSDMLGHRKLQIETRLKLLAKWSPSKYGDRTGIELTGANGGPVQISDTERAARLAAIVAVAQQRAQQKNQKAEIEPQERS